MGAVLSDEGCFGREPRPWDDRWEALKAVLEAELEARRAHQAEHEPERKAEHEATHVAEQEEAPRRREVQEAPWETMLLGRVQREGGEGPIVPSEKEGRSENTADLLN